MLDKYPFPEVRPGVLDAMKAIETAKLQGKRFIKLHGSTGCGKSAIAVWFARTYKSLIITPTKLLQHQYADTKEFKDEYVVFGKSNYACMLPGIIDTTVNEAICCSEAVVQDNTDLIPWMAEPEFKTAGKALAQTLKKKCAAENICPYYTKLAQIGTKPGAVLNYDLLVHIKRRSETLGINLGSTIVMDEAHTLLDKVRSVYGYLLNNTYAVRVLGQLGRRLDGEAPVDWLKRLRTEASAALIKETDTKKAATLSNFHLKLDHLLSMSLTDTKKFHIDDTGDQIEIKPLDIRFLKETIFKPFNCILLLSATFPDNFCDLLGIDPTEVVDIKIQSTFAKENRPAIFVKQCPAINYKTVLDDNHQSIRALKQILLTHKLDKGIIHCSSYKMFNQLKDLIGKNKRFIWVEQTLNKADVLEEHRLSIIPTVLISPSMMEGVDLKDELARFQVMFKLPFSALDDYTKKMMDIFPNYYENETITKILQAYGRAVRSAEDHAVFYILDGAFSRLMNSHRKLFSEYFLEALQVA